MAPAGPDQNRPVLTPDLRQGFDVSHFARSRKMVVRIVRTFVRFCPAGTMARGGKTSRSVRYWRARAFAAAARPIRTRAVRMGRVVLPERRVETVSPRKNCAALSCDSASRRRWHAAVNPHAACDIGARVHSPRRRVQFGRGRVTGGHLGFSRILQEPRRNGFGHIQTQPSNEALQCM
jgi:hypothetical protein